MSQKDDSVSVNIRSTKTAKLKCNVLLIHTPLKCVLFQGPSLVQTNAHVHVHVYGEILLLKGTVVETLLYYIDIDLKFVFEEHTCFN